MFSKRQLPNYFRQFNHDIQVAEQYGVCTEACVVCCGVYHDLISVQSRNIDLLYGNALLGVG